MRKSRFFLYCLLLIAFMTTQAESQEKEGLNSKLGEAVFNCYPTVVRSLLGKGAHANAKYAVLKEPEEMLLHAALCDNPDIVRALIEHGANIDPRDNNGRTPLWIAAFAGKIKAVQILLQLGADINAKDKLGQTPLMAASLRGYSGMFGDKGNAEIVDILLAEGADINAMDDRGYTALRSTVSEGLTHIVKLLLKKGAKVDMKDPDGQTPLMIAAALGHSEILKELLSNNADVNTKDVKDQTALIYAVDKGHADIVDLLLEKGSDVNVKLNNGATALWMAVKSKDNIQIVQSLVNKGADLNAKHKDGETPLIRAAVNGNTAIMSILIDAGADVCAKDQRGLTALNIAKARGLTDILDLLEAKVAKDCSTKVEQQLIETIDSCCAVQSAPKKVISSDVVEVLNTYFPSANGNFWSYQLSVFCDDGFRDVMLKIEKEYIEFMDSAFLKQYAYHVRQTGQFDVTYEITESNVDGTNTTNLNMTTNFSSPQTFVLSVDERRLGTIVQTVPIKLGDEPVTYSRTAFIFSNSQVSDSVVVEAIRLSYKFSRDGNLYTVNTPAGKFNDCMRMHEEVAMGSGSWETDSYYAPHVGLVLRHQKDIGGATMSYIKLKEYRAGGSMR